MTWIKLEDSFPSNPKVVGLSDAAFRAYVTALCYCAAHLTDGNLPPAAFPLCGLTPEVRAELRKVGLIFGRSSHPRIHDFLEHQRSREQVLAERNAAKERQKRSRLSRKRHGVTNGVSHGVSHGEVRLQSRVEERREEELTGELPVRAREAEPIPPPVHGVRFGESFWQGVDSWPGPTEQHRDFARQNGLDCDLEARHYRAERSSKGYRCADFNADFAAWLARSLKFARRGRAAPDAAPVVELPHERKERERLGEARRKRIAKLKAEGKMP